MSAKDGTGSGERPPAGEGGLAPTQTHVYESERLPPGTLLASRYRILGVAGVGGMGVVYRARDDELGIDVALKVLRRDLAADPKFVERFRGELLLARQVTHPNVVRIHDIGEHDGTRFLTMTFVEGKSLREMLETEGRLSPDRALPIVRQIAAGLGAAHAAGIVHRDLKPANILIDPAGHASITDFGVARSISGDGRTRAGAVVGTPEYLAPEQVSGDPVDGRTDLYALGIVFFEMLSGELPFPGPSQAELLAQRLAGRPRNLTDTGVDTPAGVQRLVGRCLERSPSRRYQTSEELVIDLDRTATARPRRRWPALAAATALFAAAAGGLLLLAKHRSKAETATAAAPRHAVAVLPLADEAADPALAWAGAGVAEMLATSLAESPNLRVMDSLRVLRSVRDLRLTGGRYDDAALSSLAQLWNVDRLVTGTLRRAGSRVRIDLRVSRAEAGGSLAASSVAAESEGVEGVFGAVAGLAQRLRAELGLPERGVVEKLEPATRSVEAERAYQEGCSRLAVGDEIGAAPHLEKAAAADPGFAEALERLAQTYQGLGYQEKAMAAGERALKAAGQSRSRRALRAGARLALLRGEPKQAEETYRELSRRYPGDTQAFLDLAAAQAAQGHSAEAVATLQKAVALDPNDPRAWLQLGRNASLTGDGPRAIRDYLVRALTLQSQLNNAKGRADVLVAIGAAYQKLTDYPHAFENYDAALKILRDLQDDRAVATTLRSRAHIEQSTGKIREAEADLQEARRLYEKVGDTNGLSDSWNSIGLVEESRGAYGKALEAYQNALRFRRTLGDERLLAQSYDNVGYMYYLKGEYDNAIVYWQPALDLRRKIGEKSGIVLSLQSLGFLQTAQGRWDVALKSFVEALEKGREIDLKDAIAVSLGNMGTLYGLGGRFSAALDAYDEALGVAKQIDFKNALTEFTLKKADLLIELGSTDRARPLVEQAEAWIAETGNREQAGDLEVVRGGFHLARRETAAAQRAFAKAIPLTRESGSRVSLLQAQIAAAVARRGAGDLAGSRTALAAALKEAESRGHALMMLRAAEGLAEVELARGRPREAAAPLRRAREIAERAGWHAGLYRLTGLEERIRRAAGDRAGSDESVRRGAQELARLRENLPADLRAAFEALPAVQSLAGRVKT